MATKTKQVIPAKKQPQAAASTEVATRPNKAPRVVNDANELNAELMADSGKGFEEANKDAYAIPFLTLLQDLSPQTKKKMPGYIEGAKPGQIFQSVSLELFDDVRVIPCHYSQVFIEWIPRSKGGGFVASYDPVEGAKKALTGIRDGGKLTLPNGNELADTRQHFVLVVAKDGLVAAPALLALKATGLKVSRRWMAQMRSAMIEVNGRLIEPPMFAWSYRLTAEEEANEQGSWYAWSITDRTAVSNLDLYRQAKLFGQSMKGGAVKVNYDEMQTHVDSPMRDFSDRGPADIDDNEIEEGDDT